MLLLEASRLGAPVQMPAVQCICKTWDGNASLLFLVPSDPTTVAKEPPNNELVSHHLNLFPAELLKVSVGMLL